MGIVLTNHSVSLDGSSRGGTEAAPLHEWLSTGEHQSRHGDNFKLSDTSRDVFDGLIDRLGATIAGRKTYGTTRTVGAASFRSSGRTSSLRTSLRRTPTRCRSPSSPKESSAPWSSHGGRRREGCEPDGRRHRRTGRFSRTPGRDRHRHRPARRRRAAPGLACDSSGRARAGTHRRRAGSDASQLSRREVISAARRA